MADVGVSAPDGQHAERVTERRFYVMSAVMGGMSALTLATGVVLGVAVGADRPDTGCLAEGVGVCMVNGFPVASLRDMPADPYDRCLFLLSVSSQYGGVEYDGSRVCEEVGENR